MKLISFSFICTPHKQLLGPYFLPFFPFSSFISSINQNLGKGILANIYIPPFNCFTHLVSSLRFGGLVMVPLVELIVLFESSDTVAVTGAAWIEAEAMLIWF